MAKFDGTTLPFKWYLGATTFEEAGFNVSKSYARVTKNSKNNITLEGRSNIWGENYQVTTLYRLKRGDIISSKLIFSKGQLSVSKIKGITTSDLNETDLDLFNEKYLKYGDEILASRNDDYINSRDGDDFVWGNKGDDILIGGNGDDYIIGGKGADYIEGGYGVDVFEVSKSNGKGKNNLDYIGDFEIGKDYIYIDGKTKGLRLDSSDGDAVLIKGKKDVIAWIEGASGLINWSKDGQWIM